jgi:hypothetical protein
MTSETIRFSRNRRPRRLRHGLALVFSCVLAVFSALSLCPLRAAASQEGHREAYRLVTRDEGLAIVDAISDHHQSLRGKRAKPDCSHLVNDIYDFAGFPYPYAKSADLYRGQASFVRVSAPQPGGRLDRLAGPCGSCPRSPSTPLLQLITLWTGH